MHEKWRKQLSKPSGNLTTNAAMPEWIADKLLEDTPLLQRKLALQRVEFPAHENDVLDTIEGLQILKGLQRNVREGHLTLFRAVRFPTSKRMYDVVTQTGFTISNFEQERILALYTDDDYRNARAKNQSDERFWVQPQERVVEGVPVFALVNDAIQIHRAYRGKEDNVLIVAVHIPHRHLEEGTIRLIANTAIDLDYGNADRDVPVRDFREKDGVFEVDYAALRARGVDLHEMYSPDLPLTYAGAVALGIKQEFYLLDLYEIEDFAAMSRLKADTQTLMENRAFLHGLFGDQNIFGRRRTQHLPFACYRVSRSEA